MGGNSFLLRIDILTQTIHCIEEDLSSTSLETSILSQMTHVSPLHSEYNASIMITDSMTTTDKHENMRRLLQSFALLIACISSLARPYHFANVFCLHSMQNEKRVIIQYFSSGICIVL
ncbi:hypothetical protein CARUB_v10022331mg [Capsella rubella]|uniref:Uncharacterized protein n=1 Tax=Capsella rubella TaxID=81985 RepID=R0HY11_9BRAS|nr:hypothetical protein CARUB_v10022331mg [Capsella rubella]